MHSTLYSLSAVAVIDPMGDYYDVLGVDRSASEPDIKKAYRRIAMKYHPDRNPGDKTAEERFKEAARQLETDDDEERFNERLKELAKQKPEKGKPDD